MSRTIHTFFLAVFLIALISPAARAADLGLVCNEGGPFHIDFDGATGSKREYMGTDSLVDLGWGTDFSIGITLRPDDLSPRDQTYVYFAEQSGLANRVLIYWNDNNGGELKVWLQSDSASWGNSYYSAGEGVHLVLTVTDNEAKLYINGVERAPVIGALDSFSFATVDRFIHLFHVGAGVSPANGAWQQLWTMDRVLTPQEVATTYDQRNDADPLAGLSSGNWHLWMPEDGGDMGKDYAGSGIDLMSGANRISAGPDRVQGALIPSNPPFCTDVIPNLCETLEGFRGNGQPPLNCSSVQGNADYIPKDLLITYVQRDCPGVVDDGVTDAAVALQGCIEKIDDSQFRKTLYFPRKDTGVYRMSAGLIAQTEGGVPNDRIRFLCDDGVRFVLDDGAAGFGDAANPKAFMLFGNPAPGEAYNNDWDGCGIDLGNNPGAIGIDWTSNNVASIRRTEIEGDSFYAGIKIARKWPGPALIKDVDIYGGQYGIHVTYRISSLVFENIRTIGQSVAGISIQDQTATILRHTSYQPTGVPALLMPQSISGTAIWVLDPRYQSGQTGGSAIRVDPWAARPQLFVRNMKSSGYSNSLEFASEATITDPDIAEWASDTITAFSPSVPATMDFDLGSHPRHVQPDPSKWRGVVGTDTENEKGALLQSWIDDPDGPEVIYCSGFVQLNSTLVITAGTNLRRIHGFDCGFFGGPNFTGPLIQVDSDAPVEIREMHISADGLSDPRIVHSGSGDLILTDVTDIFPYRSTPGAGTLYVENSSSEWIELNGNDLRAVQLDAEGAGNGIPKITINGGRSRIYGYKTESNGSSPTLYVSGGAEVEAFGGWILGSTNPYPAPAQQCANSYCAFGFATSVDNPPQQIALRTIRGASQVDITKPQMPNRGQGYFTALYLERP